MECPSNDEANSKGIVNEYKAKKAGIKNHLSLLSVIVIQRTMPLYGSGTTLTAVLIDVVASLLSH